MINKIKPYVNRIKNNSLARDTIWTTLARGIGILIQAAYFIIIARVLGVQKYGAFVSVTALISILAPFASWGSDHILVKNVSRKRSLFAVYWGNALLIILLSGFVLLTFVLLSYSAFLPSTIPFLVVFFVAISDLLFAIILRTATRAFQAIHRLDITAMLTILSYLTRLLAAVCLATFFSQPGIITWAGLYMIGTVVAAAISLLFVHYHLGKPKLAPERIKAELLPGFYFSASMSSLSIYNHIDKTMLARLSTLEATGIYASAYRLIEVSLVPITSLVFASYPNFFKHGAKGIRGSLHFARKLLPMGAAYSLATGIAILICAPIIPFVLGEEYATAVGALRWLALSPFLICLHTFAGNTLTGADLQGFRTAMQASTAVFNVLANLWLIPIYSWKGAAWSTLASESLLALGCWGLVAWYYYHHDRGGKAS